MYEADVYLIAGAGLAAALAFLAALGALVEHLEKKRAFERLVQENRERLGLPRRRGVCYVQQWDEVLEERGEKV